MKKCLRHHNFYYINKTFTITNKFKNFCPPFTKPQAATDGGLRVIIPYNLDYSSGVDYGVCCVVTGPVQGIPLFHFGYMPYAPY
jgi:hypothetical protein